MPQKQFPFESAGPNRLGISYKGYYKDFVITLDGKTIGTLPDDKELIKGRIYTLPDKSKLSVKLIKRDAYELEILRNGKPLPGSASDPKQILRTASFFVFFLGGLNLLIGLAVMAFDYQFLSQISAGKYSVMLGSLMCLLGLLVIKRSRIALALAIGLFLFDGLIGFISSGNHSGFAILGARIIFILPCFQGFKAINELKKQ